MGASKIEGLGDPATSVRVRAFGAILVIEASGRSSEIERRPLRSGRATVDLMFVSEGTFAYLDGGIWRTSSGPLLVAPSGLPQRVRFTDAWKAVVARIPREALLPFVPTMKDEVGIHSVLSIPERSMESFLTRSVHREEGISPGDGRTIGHTVIEMAGTLLRGRQGIASPRGTPQAMLRDRALAVIAEKYADLILEPIGVARELGVSLRHLQSIFAEAGTAVASEIRRERARVARSILQDSRFDDLSVTEVARQSGFGSTASFRRSLKSLYRLSPHEFRAGRPDTR